MTLLDGNKPSNEIKEKISEQIKSCKTEPALAAILVGDDPSSKKYLELKDKDCTEVGINFENFQLPADATLKKVTNLIQKLNRNAKFDGILVQFPVPDHLNKKSIIKAVDPAKDVDGLHAHNVGKLWTSDYDIEKDLIPCTPKGIIKLLDFYDIDLQKKRAVIINRSDLVGKPLAKLMLDRDATVTICHSQTKKVENYTKTADILVTAVGRRPDFVVTVDMITQGSIVIDVGMNYLDEGLRGDVNFEELKEKTSYITPVPGGVGPMTRVSLLENVVIASR